MADVNESNVYVVTQGRKLYGMPTEFGFCIKVKTLAWPGLGGNGGCSVPRILPGASELHLDTQTPLPAPCTLHLPLPCGDGRHTWS